MNKLILALVAFFVLSLASVANAVLPKGCLIDPLTGRVLCCPTKTDPYCGMDARTLRIIDLFSGSIYLSPR